MEKKPNFKKQFRGVEIEYRNGFIKVSIKFKEPNDSNSVWVDIGESSVSISKTTRDSGEFIKEFDYW